MSQGNEIYFLLETFAQPLGAIWRSLPTDYRPVIILDSAECKNPFEFLYILLESKLESYGSHLSLDIQRDAQLSNKLDELRVLCRFIDGMSNCSFYLYDKPIDLDNPAAEQQDLRIWETFGNICSCILQDPILRQYSSHELDFSKLYSAYTISYIDNNTQKSVQK